MRNLENIVDIVNLILGVIKKVKTECNGTRAESRFGLPAKRTSPFISVGVSVQSTAGFLAVRVVRERLYYR